MNTAVFSVVNSVLMRPSHIQAQSAWCGLLLQTVAARTRS